MLRRVPPVALAAIATALVAVVVIAVVLLTGGDRRTIPPCTAAQDDGPYGCIVFVSIDGSVGGRAATEPQSGAITFRVSRTDGRDHLVWTGDCTGGEGDAAVTATRIRLGEVISGQKACPGGAPVDAWARRVFTSDAVVRVEDRDDGTVDLVRGDVRVRFDQVVAPGP